MCKCGFRTGHAISFAQQVRDVGPFGGCVGMQKNWMMTDVDTNVRKVFRQDFVEPVLADETSGASNLGIEVDLQHVESHFFSD